MVLISNAGFKSLEHVTKKTYESQHTVLSLFFLFFSKEWLNPNGNFPPSWDWWFVLSVGAHHHGSPTYSPLNFWRSQIKPSISSRSDTFLLAPISQRLKIFSEKKSSCKEDGFCKGGGTKDISRFFGFFCGICCYPTVQNRIQSGVQAWRNEWMHGLWGWKDIWRDGVRQMGIVLVTLGPVRSWTHWRWPSITIFLIRISLRVFFFLLLFLLLLLFSSQVIVWFPRRHCSQFLLTTTTTTTTTNKSKTKPLTANPPRKDKKTRKTHTPNTQIHKRRDCIKTKTQNTISKSFFFFFLTTEEYPKTKKNSQKREEQKKEVELQHQRWEREREREQQK